MARNMGPPKEGAGPEGQPDPDTQTTPRQGLESVIRSVRETRSNLAGDARSGVLPRPTRCPRGCPLGYHGCGHREPIEHDFGKFDESGVFVSCEGSVCLISLRQHRERVAR
jgi:hypothetical protein